MRLGVRLHGFSNVPYKQVHVHSLTCVLNGFKSVSLCTYQVNINAFAHLRINYKALVLESILSNVQTFWTYAAVMSLKSSDPKIPKSQRRSESKVKTKTSLL